MNYDAPSAIAKRYHLTIVALERCSGVVSGGVYAATLRRVAATAEISRNTRGVCTGLLLLLVAGTARQQPKRPGRTQ
jgi:hypothetical protein